VNPRAERWSPDRLVAAGPPDSFMPRRVALAGQMMAALITGRVVGDAELPALAKRAVAAADAVLKQIEEG
jgi:hypothetical protein